MRAQGTRTVAAVFQATDDHCGPKIIESGSGKKRSRKVHWRDHAAQLEELVQQRPLDASAGAGFAAQDVSGLPPELLKELSVGKGDPLDAQIIAVLRASGGTADLDQLLIGLYRKFQVIQKRRFLQNKLWRMVRKGEVEKVKNMRGYFALARGPRKQGKKRRK